MEELFFELFNVEVGKKSFMGTKLGIVVYFNWDFILFERVIFYMIAKYFFSDYKKYLHMTIKNIKKALK